MAFLGQEEQLRELQERFRFLNAIVFIALGLLLSRLVYLQILKGDELRRYSEENRIKRVNIAAPRGMIFDRYKRLLIDNQPAFDLEITPQYLRDSGRKQEVIKLLSSLINMPEEEILSKLEKSNQPSFAAVKIKTNLTRDEVAKIETWKIAMPGVAVELEIQRTNVYKDVASHFLGYISKINSTELPALIKEGKKYKLGDNIGKVGIEKQLEDVLRGNDGQELVEVDAMGRLIRKQEGGRFLEKISETSAVPGNNLILTIDQDLQIAAMEAFGEKVGGLVAMDPRNGEILAMVSRPSFDPTEFSRGISPALWQELLNNEDHPLRDKTIQDHYSPGSVFKPLTAIVGLEEGVINKSTRFHCGGKIQLGNREYHCHKPGGHGDVNVTQALAVSCDIFFYRVAQKLKTVDLIAKWAERLGLARRTGINLAREVPGLIPTEGWKMARFGQPWTTGESLTVAIGQSFVLTTVIQLANMFSAIANEGTLFRPHYVHSYQSPDGKILKEFGPEVIGKAGFTKETIKLVKEGLYNAINTPGGTGYWQRLPGMEMAGKTGTSQVVRIAKEKIYHKCENLKYRQRHHGLFVGFAPMDDPAIVVAVIAEHSCHGASGAAPIAREVIKRYLEKNYPDKWAKKVPPVPVGPPPADATEEDQIINDP